jgi:hypothetical protein
VRNAIYAMRAYTLLQIVNNIKMSSLGCVPPSVWEDACTPGSRRPAGGVVAVERDRRWPRSHARWPAREGGGRDAAWQRG